MPYMTKAGAGLVATDDESADLLADIKLGETVHVEIKRPRNIGFHRKFFAMLSFAFDHWEPAEQDYNGRAVGKNKDVFRAWCIAKAGYYDLALTPDGKVKAEPKSIKFSKMGESEFEALYNDVVNVVLSGVLTNYKRADLDDVVERLCRF